MGADAEKQALKDAFLEGRLTTIAGEFIPCDYVTPLLAAPFGFIANVLPLTALILCFGQAIVRDPKIVLWFYHRVLETDWQTNLFGGAIIFFVLWLCLKLFLEGWPKLRMVGLGMLERCRERRTGQYRYGLLITDQFLAIRCFKKAYIPCSRIFARAEIIQFYLCSERSELSNTRVQFVVMQHAHGDGPTQKLRLPTTHIDCNLRKLYYRLLAWVSKG